MKSPAFDTSAAWRVDQLDQAKGWVFPIAENDVRQLARAAKDAFDPERPLFDYRRDDFDLGDGLATITAAAREAYFGCGLSLVRGLPRADLTGPEFRLLTWAIGLHLGVARPQGRASQYISDVTAAGGTYRSAGGRGYNTNASLDFHADGCDIVALACFNKARAGGQSMMSSSATAWQVLCAERPDLAEVALQDFCFSRNQEQAPDENPFYAQPLYDFADGRIFGKWNRNRVRTAQDLDGVPPLTDAQKECTDLLDEILRRPDVMYTMWLEPGDLQFMNNHVMLHSRTTFEDYEEEDRKRLLFRLWMAPPFSVPLPETWGDYFRSIKPGTVRGGIRGHQHDDVCRAFERRQAGDLGMPIPA
ncbi:MAG: TauD/TfdA family dioxygenase [Rhodospirillaceae bacterium]